MSAPTFTVQDFFKEVPEEKFLATQVTTVVTSLALIVYCGWALDTAPDASAMIFSGFIAWCIVKLYFVKSFLGLKFRNSIDYSIDGLFALALALSGLNLARHPIPSVMCAMLGALLLGAAISSKDS